MYLKRSFPSAFGFLLVLVSLNQSVIGDVEADDPAGVINPNFLWLTIEDTSSYEFGCYGNSQVNTPNIDALAARSVLFTHASSSAPQCSPARSTLISGSPATTYGTGYHRRKFPAAEGRPFYPLFLEEAGYTCLNVTKTDYNIQPEPELWNEGESYDTVGEPFLAVYNNERTHMTSVHSLREPGAHIPSSDIDISHLAHLPDLPEIRANYAWHLKAVEDVDRWVGEKLDELRASGKADDTIIFFYSDHGGCQPRGKAYPYESGLRIPLIIHVPKKFQHLWPGMAMGTRTDRLVGFEDFAPTLLSLAGIRPPESMQGKAFMGPYAEAPRTYQFGFRTNQGHHFDPIRTVSDGRFKYIRNYIPQKPLEMRQRYQWGLKANQAYDAAHMKGQLQAKYARFFEAKPTEELYDLQADPFEMNNLAGDPAHENILQMLREQLATHIRETGDLGFFPPAARRKDDLALFDWVRASAFPLNQLHALAEAASTGQAENATMLEPYLSSKYATLRYWAATGYGTIGSKGHQVAIPKALKALLLDPNPDVAGAAAAALCYLGQEERGMQALISLMDTDNWEAFSSLEALLKNGVGTKAIRPYLPELRLRAVSENTSSEVDTRHFAYRSILVECGINSPEDLYEHEAWRIGN